jgi:hypothetical protein
MKMPRRDETQPAETMIALSTFLLDYQPPTDGGIDVLLAQRHIPVVVDRIGRRAIPEEAARTLLAEQYESEQRGRRVQAENEAKMAASYRPPGADVPALSSADGSLLSAVEVMKAAGPPPKRRQTVLDHALSNEGGGGITYHPIRDEQGNW